MCITIESIKKIQSEMETTPSFEDTLIQVMEKWDLEVAKEIKKKGSPIEIIVGSNLYDVINGSIGHYCEVTKLPSCIDDPNKIILSWLDVTKRSLPLMDERRYPSITIPQTLYQRQRMRIW